jgi:hypothetical protein
LPALENPKHEDSAHQGLIGFTNFSKPPVFLIYHKLMPALANPKHEAFAQAYEESGWNATAAYRKVYKSATAICTTGGSRLLRNDKVFQRIEELTGERRRAAEQVSRLAQEYAVEAIEHLAHIMRDPKVSDSTRVRASELLLERGHGKALVQVSVNQNVRFVIEAPAVASAFDTWAAGADLALQAIEVQPDDQRSEISSSRSDQSLP